MKKQLFAFVFALAISLVTNAGQTYAQSQVFRVEVPFDFSASNKTLMAGTYIVYPATDSRRMWSIQGANQKTGAFLMAGNLSGAKESGNVGLTFRRYGNRHFLISFKTNSYQVELPKSSSEKEFQRTWDDLAKHDLVTIETKKISIGDINEK